MEVLAHAIAWAVSEVSSAGWSGVQEAITKDPMIMFGFIVSNQWSTSGTSADSM